MAVLGILTCEILELEFAYLLGEDSDITTVAVLEDHRSQRLIKALEAQSIDTIRRLPSVASFKPDHSQPWDILIKDTSDMSPNLSEIKSTSGRC